MSFFRVHLDFQVFMGYMVYEDDDSKYKCYLSDELLDLPCTRFLAF